MDYVALGCPHCTLNQIKEIAELLDGKKVKDGVILWVHTNMMIKAFAQQMGFMDTIEKAGGVLTQDLCTVLGNPEALGVSRLATNSPKMAFYAPGSNSMSVWYGNVNKCINAALTGRWEG